MTTKTDRNITRYDETLNQIEAFETQYSYDCSYMRAMLEHAPEALEIFNGFVPMAGHRAHAPLEVYFTAKLTAYQHADCGPCLQLAIRFAKEAGVRHELLETLIYDKGDLPDLLERARRFTLACLENDPTHESLRAELEAELGKAAVIELALTIAAAQVFPVVKRAMGFYQSCELVTLDL